MPKIDSPFNSYNTLLQSAIWSISILRAPLCSLLSAIMATELEKPRITEIQVRMDCNGCVQKIKKALHGINGIYEVYIDFPEQKITIVGRADPEKIVKAIKKTRKSAVICSHTEQQPDPPPPPQPSEQPPEGGAPPPESSSPPQPEAEETAKAKAKDPPPVPPENQAADNKEKQSPETDQTSKPKDNVEEVHHVIYHYPPHYGYKYTYGPSSTTHGYTQQWNNSQPPLYVSHSYNSYKPSPHVTRYDQYVHSSPSTYTHYGRPDDEHYYTMMAEDYFHYTDDDDYHNADIESEFCEENPNSCTIV